MPPLSLYQMMFANPQQSGQGFAAQPQQTPQQRWLNLISRPSTNPNAAATQPTNPYEGLLNMTTNMGMQDGQPVRPNPAGIPDWMRGAAPGGQQGAGYRNLGMLGLGMLQPRQPY